MTWTMSLSMVLSLVIPLHLWPGAASADTFYTCTKKGSLSAYVNAPEVEKYKKDGWRCRSIFKTGSKGGAAAKTAPAKTSKKSKPRPNTSSGGNAIPDAHKSTRDEDRVRGLLPHVQAATSRYDIPIPFVLAVMKVESAFKPRALSSAGAQGLMQVMPFNCKPLGIRDPFDPAQNILGGTRLLRQLANRFEGDMVQVLAAYHAGGGAVSKKAGIPYEQTDLYVRKVLDYYYHYKRFYPAH